jgi:putative endonuclease
MTEKQPCVYILAKKKHGVLYIGVTSNLMQRLYQHRGQMTGGFSAKYGIYKLIRYEMFEDMTSAIAREKQLKNWHREWKTNLIEQDNPEWVDLALSLGFAPIR